MAPFVEISGRRIGPGYPDYIVAAMSANHDGRFDRTVELGKTAGACGADAMKLQTYSPVTLTIDCGNDYFRIEGTLWYGRGLFDLYKEALTAWDRQPKLKEVAAEMSLDLFSTPLRGTENEIGLLFS